MYVYTVKHLGKKNKRSMLITVSFSILVVPTLLCRIKMTYPFCSGCTDICFMANEMLEVFKDFGYTKVRLWLPPCEWLGHIIILHTSHNCFKSK